MTDHFDLVRTTVFSAITAVLKFALNYVFERFFFGLLGEQNGLQD